MNLALLNPRLPKCYAAKSRNLSRGFTLIEVLLVLTLVSTLLASTISLMMIVKKSDKQAARTLQNRHDIRRFADDIRRDLQSEREVRIQGSDLLIDNESESSQTTYRVRSGSAIDRVVTDADQKPTARETYEVGIHAKIEVRWLEEDRLIQWTIVESNRKSRPIQIVAVLRSESR